MGFLKIQFVAKYQKKINGGPFGDIEKFSKKFHKVEKECGESLTAPRKLERWDPSVVEWILRGFGCVPSKNGTHPKWNSLNPIVTKNRNLVPIAGTQR